MKRPWPILVLALVPLGILVWFAVPPSAPDAGALKGSWQREDGDYRLVVKEVREGGGVEAEYYNPKRINVGEARTESKDGVRLLHVVLRDENYPGSTYTLGYDAAGDRLGGEYYQAVQGQRMGVSFRRAK